MANLVEMKRFFQKVYILFLLLPIGTQAQDTEMHKLLVDVVYLASDYLEGRETGTPGEEKAAAYIANRFEEIGLSPKGDNNSWYQEFPFFERNPHSNNPHEAKKGTGKNVIGYLNKKAKNTIVIGGHYDHLGYESAGSRHTGDPAIHNGADDNASGIAAMLMMAEYFKDKKLKSNILFIAFSGEEKGLFGSKAFVENPTIDLKKVNYMINMDMIGKLNEEKTIVINGAGTSPLWKSSFEKLNVDGIQIVTTDSGIGPSDHTSFYLKDLPALHFFTGNHEHYHKPSDDVEIVNFEGIRSVGKYIIALIEELNDKGKIAFSKTVDAAQDKQVADFKVTLGVMPDYVYQGSGMRIDGIISGRVAEKAGLEKGDIVVRIDEMEIKDIYVYMEALAKYKKGDAAKITVQRGESEVVKDVVF